MVVECGPTLLRSLDLYKRFQLKNLVSGYFIGWMNFQNSNSQPLAPERK
jgi:hypothetical protein